ncbi:MAG: 30S ribosomal protein S6 [Gemmataceae bacterium]
MPVNLYECMLMLDSGKVSGDLPAFVNQLHGTFEKHKADIQASRPWDERRLSYPVKKQKKALFYLTYFKADSQAVLNIEHDLKLNESVIRHMVMKIEPKLSEAMLAVAKDSHALALQTAHEDVDDYDAMGGGR